MGRTTGRLEEQRAARKELRGFVKELKKAAARTAGGRAEGRLSRFGAKLGPIIREAEGELAEVEVYVEVLEEARSGEAGTP